MGAKPIPLGKQSEVTHIPPGRNSSRRPRGPVTWEPFNPPERFCSFVLIRFHMTTLTFVLLLVESPTWGGGVFSFSEYHRVEAEPHSPGFRGAGENRRGGSGIAAGGREAVPAEPQPALRTGAWPGATQAAMQITRRAVALKSPKPKPRGASVTSGPEEATRSRVCP